MTSQTPPDAPRWEPTAAPYRPPAANPYAPQNPYTPQGSQAGPPYASPYQNPANPPWSPDPSSQPPDIAAPQSPTPGAGPAKVSHKRRGLVVAAVIALVAAGGGAAYVQSSHKSKSSHTVSIPKPFTPITTPKVSPNSANSAASVPTGKASTATSGSSVDSPTTTAPPPVNGSAGSALPVQAEDWRLDSTTFDADVLGDFSGTAKVSYIGKRAPTANATIFEITLFVNGKQVATLEAGPVDGLTGGQTTVALLSGDPLVPGPYTYVLSVNSL